jgi:hypothetical protein
MMLSFGVELGQASSFQLSLIGSVAGSDSDLILQ